MPGSMWIGRGQKGELEAAASGSLFVHQRHVSDMDLRRVNEPKADWSAVSAKARAMLVRQPLTQHGYRPTVSDR
jgi:hypothetical protein